MKIIAIDPGKAGGLAYFDGKEVITRKYTTEHEFTDHILSLPLSESVAVFEDVPVFVSSATSSSSSFKLGYNYGFQVGVLRSLKVSVNLVKPQIWQKGLSGLRPKMGYTDRKRMLTCNASRLFPTQKVTHAVADALLILHWFAEKKNIIL